MLDAFAMPSSRVNRTFPEGPAEIDLTGICRARFIFSRSGLEFVFCPSSHRRVPASHCSSVRSP
jgi:hypothetical protein